MAKMYKMTTEIPEAITIPDQVETSIGTLEFFDGMPSDETVSKAYDFLDLQRGVSVFLDEMRAASLVAMREGLRDIGVIRTNQVAIFEDLMDSKALWLTANSETVYASTFLDLNTDGPTVIESPPNVLGILDDMWFRYVGDTGNAGPDWGKGGKYLVLPPGYEGDVPDGYHVYQSRTYGVWFLVRGFLVEGDPGPAVKNLKEGLRIYALAKADNPPAMEFINVSGKYHNTIHANNFQFFEEINTLIQEEHDDSISRETRGRLAQLGTIKGRPFEPDERMRNILNEAALIGAAAARSMSFRSRDDVTYFYPDDDKTWFSAFAVGTTNFWLKTGFFTTPVPCFTTTPPGSHRPWPSLCRGSARSTLRLHATPTASGWTGHTPTNLPSPRIHLPKISGRWWPMTRKPARCCKRISSSPALTTSPAARNRMPTARQTFTLAETPLAKKGTGSKPYPAKASG